VQHLTILPDMKSRLLLETESVLKAAQQTGLVRSLTTEMVDNFNFTRNCFYESLRMEPPTSVSGASCFSKDTKIGGINFVKDMGFVIMMFLMHRNPKEWSDPDSFNPDRFDSTSPHAQRPNGG
jgi:cytochrome P450